MAFHPLRNSDHIIASFSIYFPSSSKGDAPFQGKAYDYLRADWNGLCDYLRDVPWENVFKLGSFSATTEFFGWVKVRIDVYISHRKYLVKPHSSPWFSASCTVVTALRNHFFCLYLQKSERVLEAAKLAYASKTRV